MGSVSAKTTDDLCLAAGIDKSTFWHMQQDGLLPKSRPGVSGHLDAVSVAVAKEAHSEYRWRRKYSGDYTPLFKKCRNCGFEKPISMFRISKSKSGKYGYDIRRRCSICEAGSRKRGGDSEIAYKKEWRKRNKEKLRAYYSERAKRADVAIDKRISKQIKRALNGGKEWRGDLPFTISELVNHLERQFVDGMSWDNMGEWHIDHIIPKSSFAYTTTKDKEFLQCWALSNLRPLWGKDNVKKGSKILYLI